MTGGTSKLGALALGNLGAVGIVPMEQALADEATKAQEKVTKARLPTNKSGYFWCTLCRAPMLDRSARRHKELHAGQWGGLRDPAEVQRLGETLDREYGNLLHMLHSTCSSATTCGTQ
jgi:hypothetical protein